MPNNKYLNSIKVLENDTLKILRTDPRTFNNPIDEDGWFFDEIFEIYQRIREAKEKIYERNRA